MKTQNDDTVAWPPQLRFKPGDILKYTENGDVFTLIEYTGYINGTFNHQCRYKVDILADGEIIGIIVDKNFSGFEST